MVRYARHRVYRVTDWQVVDVHGQINDDGNEDDRCVYVRAQVESKRRIIARSWLWMRKVN